MLIPAYQIEPCHGKACLKIFGVVIPNERLAGGGSAYPLFGMGPSINYVTPKGGGASSQVLPAGRVQFYSWCHTQRRIGGTPAGNPSLGMTMAKILRHVFP